MNSPRIVLEHRVHPNDIVRLARDLGWTLSGQVEQSDDIPFELIWLTPDGRVGVHYVEDHLINVRFFLLVGDNTESVEAEIRQRVQTVEREDLLSRARSVQQSGQQATNLVNLIAAIAPRWYDREMFEVFMRFLAHPDPEVRHATVFATAYPGWPEFRPFLREIEQSDPSPSVRELASEMLQALERHNWSVDERGGEES